jgi:hypothetical protein
MARGRKNPVGRAHSRSSTRSNPVTKNPDVDTLMDDI